MKVETVYCCWYCPCKSTFFSSNPVYKLDFEATSSSSYLPYKRSYSILLHFWKTFGMTAAERDPSMWLRSKRRNDNKRQNDRSRYGEGQQQLHRRTAAAQQDRRTPIDPFDIMLRSFCKFVPVVIKHLARTNLFAQPICGRMSFRPCFPLYRWNSSIKEALSSHLWSLAHRRKLSASF